MRRANRSTTMGCLSLLSLAMAMPATAEIVRPKPAPTSQSKGLKAVVTIEQSAETASKAYRSLHMGIAQPRLLPDCTGKRGAPVRIRLSNVLEDLGHPRHSIARAIKRGEVGDDPEKPQVYTKAVDRPDDATIPIPTNLDMELKPTPDRKGHTPMRIVLRKSNGIQFMTPANLAIVPYAWSTAAFCGPVKIDDYGDRWVLKFGVVDEPKTVGGFNIGILVPDWSGEDDPIDAVGNVPTYWMPLYPDPAVKNVG